MKLFVFVSVVILATDSVKLPSNFKTCNRKQSNFRGCLLKAAQHGAAQLNREYKELKMPNLDPLVIPIIETSVETVLFNVSSELTACEAYQLLQLNIEKFDFDFESKTVQLVASWPEMKTRCSFRTAGQIVFTDVIAEGVIRTTYKNLKWTFDLTYEEEKKENKTYVKASTSSFDAEPEDVIFDLIEVKKGDKETVELVIQAINDNWKNIYELVRDVYLEKSRTGWLEVFSGLFSEVSLEEAFDN